MLPSSQFAFKECGGVITQEAVDFINDNFMRNGDQSTTLCRNSLRVDPSGMAWCVSQESLLCWMYAGNSQEFSFCQTINLPSSDLRHAASLIHVGPLSPMLPSLYSCLMVAADGVILFIPNIAVSPHFEKLPVTAFRSEADEFFIAIEKLSLPPSSANNEVAYALLTSHGTVQLLLGENKGTKYMWRIENIDASMAPSSGLLTSLGRRISTYIPTLTRTDTSTALCLRSWVYGDYASVAVLSAKRVVIYHRNMKSSGNASNTQTITSTYQIQIGDLLANHLNGSSFEPVDIAFDYPPYNANFDNEFPPIVLVYGNRSAKSAAFAKIELSRDKSSLEVSSLRIVSDLPSQMANELRQLRCVSVSSFVFLYTSTDVIILRLGDAKFQQFLSCSDANAVLGATVFNGSVPIFINRMTGISALICDDLPLPPFSFPLLRRKASVASSRTALQRAQKATNSKEIHERLEAAWIYFTVQDMSSCLKIVTSLSKARNLEFTMAQLAWSALDEKLPTDPRWKRFIDANESSEKLTTSCFLFRTNSLIIADQMRAKWDAFLIFCDFATSGQLLGKHNFSRHPSFDPAQNDSDVSTVSVLCEAGERLASALTAYEFYETNKSFLSKLMATAAEYVPALLLSDSQQATSFSRSILASPTKSSAMSPADIVFANLSTAAENIAAAAVDIGDTLVSFEDVSSNDYAKAVEDVDRCIETAVAICDLLKALFIGATAFPKHRPHLYESVFCLYQCSAWHYGPFRNSVIVFLTKPFAKLMSSVWAGHHLSLLIPAFSSLAACVVESFEMQLSNIKDAMTAGACGNFKDLQHAVLCEREDVRRKFVGLLVEVSCFDDACALAESFGDFDALVRVFARNRDSEKLTIWLQRHGKAFADRLFEVLGSSPQDQELLLSLFITQPYNENPSGFLLQGEYLNWFKNFLSSSANHRLFKAVFHLEAEDGDRQIAAQTFLELALDEKRSLERRRHFASHAKLAALLLPEHSNERHLLLENIKKEQLFELYHDQLPEEALVKAGYRRVQGNVPVFSAKELINLYVGPCNLMPAVDHFLHSLELLVLLPFQEFDDGKYFIWARAVLADNWSLLDVTDPQMACKRTLFYSIAEALAPKLNSIKASRTAVNELEQLRRLLPDDPDRLVEMIRREVDSENSSAFVINNDLAFLWKLACQLVCSL